MVDSDPTTTPIPPPAELEGSAPLPEFPSDAHILWTFHAPNCVLVEYASATVHTATGNTQVGDAQAQFADIQQDGSSAPNPTTFNQTLMSNLPGT